MYIDFYISLNYFNLILCGCLCLYIYLFLCFFFVFFLCSKEQLSIAGSLLFSGRDRLCASIKRHFSIQTHAIYHRPFRCYSVKFPALWWHSPWNSLRSSVLQYILNWYFHMAHSIYSRKVMVLSQHWMFAVEKKKDEKNWKSRTISRPSWSAMLLTFLVPFAWFVDVAWAWRLCWLVGGDDAAAAVAIDGCGGADDEVVHNFTYSMPRWGVVCDFDGGCWLHTFWSDVCMWWFGYDWWRIWFCCIFTFNWYKLFDPTTSFWSFPSTALLLLLLVLLVVEVVLVKFIVVPMPMGLRMSNGLVSRWPLIIRPLIVSAGPTITLSHESWSILSNKLHCLRPSPMSSLVDAFITTTLCLGTGGAAVFGTSNSLVIFSELFESSADRFVLFVKFTRLDAPVTLAVCGFSIRFTAELSATFGEAFRGGSGGAVKFCTPLELIVSLGFVADATATTPETTGADAVEDCALLTNCCCPTAECCEWKKLSSKYRSNCWIVFYHELPYA